MYEKKLHRDKVFMKLFLTGSYTKVTEEEVDYFRQNPDLIDEVTAPVNVHKWFLWGGTILGDVKEKQKSAQRDDERNEAQNNHK